MLKKINICNHTKFIIICSKKELAEDDVKYILNHINGKDFNIERHVLQSIRHGVLSLIYKNIKYISKKQNYNHTLNSFLLSLKSNYYHIVQKNMLMTSELIKIVNILKTNHIRTLSFKGPTLSHLAYGNITQRQYNDLDILIEKKYLNKTLEILKSIGYEVEIELKSSTKKVFFNSVNVVGLLKREPFIYIEIHWELLSKNYAIKWDDTLWSHQTHTLINKHSIPTLSIENHLLYLCVHGSKHLYERLEWVCDIDRLLRSNANIDLTDTMKKAEKLGIKRIFLLSIYLCNRFFKLNLSESIKIAISQDIQIEPIVNKIVKISFKSSEYHLKNHNKFNLLIRMRENITDKFNLIFHSIFSTKFDDFKFIQLPKKLKYLYIFIRPYRLAIKYFYRN